MKQVTDSNFGLLRWTYDLDLTPQVNGTWSMVASLPGGLTLILQTAHEATEEEARRWAMESVEQVYGPAYQNCPWDVRKQLLLAMGGGLDSAQPQSTTFLYPPGIKAL